MIEFSKQKFNSKKSILISLIKTYKKSIERIVVEEFNIKVNKCGFCNNYSKIDLIFTETNEYFILTDIIYPYHNYCKLVGCPGKKINAMSREFIKKSRKLTDIEVNEFLSKKSNKGVSTLRKNGYFNDKSNNPYSKDFWNKRGINGDVKIRERIDKSFDSLRKNGYFNDKSNNPYSKDFWINRGFNHRDAQKKVNERNHVKEEFWLKFGYSLEESKVMSKKSANTISKSAFIKRYGKKIGNIKYNEYVNKIKRNWTIAGICEKYDISKKDAIILKENKIKQSILNFKSGKYSKESFNFFNEIIRDFPKSLKNICRFADNEYGKYDRNNKKYYFYDFTIPEIKICIEYHGIAFHPKKIDKVWTQPFTNKTSKEVFENDRNKEEFLKRIGYSYYTIWSDSINYCEVEKIKEEILKKYNEYERSNKIKY